MADPEETGDPKTGEDAPGTDGDTGAGAAGDGASGDPPEASPGTAGGDTIEDLPAPPLVPRDAPPGGGGGDDNGDDATIEDFPSPKLADYDPSKDREQIRGKIALILVWALVGVLVFSVASSWIVMTTENRDALVRILEIVLTPLVALVGAVTGFYYGEKSK